MPLDGVHYYPQNTQTTSLSAKHAAEDLRGKE